MGSQAAANMNMQYHSPGLHNLQPNIQNGNIQRQMLNQENLKPFSGLSGTMMNGGNTQKTSETDQMQFQNMMLSGLGGQNQS